MNQGKCNIPTCRSQDPQDCIGCVGKDPVSLYIKIGEVFAVVEEDQGTSYKVRSIIGSLDSNDIPKADCLVVKNERLIHALKVLQEFDDRESSIKKETKQYRYEVIIGVDINNSSACGRACPQLRTSEGIAKCFLFDQTVGSSSAPFRCRTCLRFVSVVGQP
jgi:hypothetical protein